MERAEGQLGRARRAARAHVRMYEQPSCAGIGVERGGEPVEEDVAIGTEYASAKLDPRNGGGRCYCQRRHGRGRGADGEQ